MKIGTLGHNDVRSSSGGVKVRRVGKGLVSSILLFALVLAGCKIEKGRRDADSSHLRSLPYASWVPVDSDDGERPVEGVTRHDPTRSYAGLNLFRIAHRSEARLIDMDGRTAHSWQADHEFGNWHHVELTSDGDLLVLVKDLGLLRLDARSQLRWAVRDRFHHDVTPTPDGQILAATRVSSLMGFYGLQVPVLEDRITTISSDGKILGHLSIAPMFARKVSPIRALRSIAWMVIAKTPEYFGTRRWKPKFLIGHDSPADLFHLNSIEVIERRIPGVCKPGDLLIAIRNLDLIAILDSETGEVSWTWGRGELERPHHPTMLDNGNILIYDNGRRRSASRIVEVEPVSKDIVWQYRGNELEPFYSPSRGSCQRLPNGNTVIAESDAGRLFEVTPDGSVVWEYFGHSRQDRDGGWSRPAIYRVRRYCDAVHLNLLGVNLHDIGEHSFLVDGL